MAFNMFAQCYTWVKFSDVCESNSLIVNIYTDKGICIPITDSYYAYTADQNLLFAVRVNTKLPINLATERPYFRLYSNAYFRSPASSGLTHKVKVAGEEVTTSTIKNNLKDFYDTYSILTGKVWVYVNGVMHEEWSDDAIELFDYVELVYDASVKNVVQIQVSDLKTFNSTLDEKHKYVLHYNGPSDNIIDYQDDIDVYVGLPDEDTAHKSLWYNKNNVDAMRNLTHRDYSLVADYIKGIGYKLTEVFASPTEIDPLDTIVTIYIRHSGYTRALVYENSRILELYKMQDEDIYSAMSGPGATVDVWKAENLEAAGYPEVMSSKYCDITNEMVERAYGYNAISKYLADTPKQAYNNNGAKGVDVPYKLQFGCTAYEYDANGILTGYYHHYHGKFYTVTTNATKYVELISGFGGDFVEEFKGERDVQYDPNFDYRVYQTTYIGGQIGTEWQDSTQEDKYTAEDGTFTWTDPSVTSYPMLRSSRRFLARDLELDTVDGALFFTLQQKVNTPNGTLEQTMQVPMGQIDVFLNGRSLIRNLDYYLDFPVVYIVNKEHLARPIASTKQLVHVRFSGLSKDMQILGDGDVGFVEHGFLSNDNEFDLRDDRVARVVVGGRLYTKSELQFSELTPGTNVLHPLNGKPYMVKDILVPVSANTTHDTYELIGLSKEIDTQVSEYLTLKIPQPTRPAPSAILNKYRLYSPFCNKLLMDLKYGRLIIPNKPSGLTRQEVLEICRPYESLLTFDPAYMEQDWRYVVVHPHGKDSVLDILAHHYQFMYQVVQYYMNDKIDLSQSVRIVEP